MYLTLRACLSLRTNALCLVHTATYEFIWAPRFTFVCGETVLAVPPIVTHTKLVFVIAGPVEVAIKRARRLCSLLHLCARLRLDEFDVPRLDSTEKHP